MATNETQYQLCAYRDKGSTTFKPRTRDLRTPMLASSEKTHGGDPIHPNATGHAIMAKAFLTQWPAISAAAGKPKAGKE